MRTPDTVAGILDPYENQFELWNNNGNEYESGSPVPAVGMAASYSVQLVGPPDAKRMFLQVQDGRITNLMALQPLGGRSVFDPRGRYLGRGGQELEPMNMVSDSKPPDIVTAVKQMTEEFPPDVHQAAEEMRGPAQVPIEERSIGQLISEMKALGAEPPEPDPHPYPDLDFLTHRFHLRSELEVVLGLPEDLTQEEAERMVLWIRALPFDKSEK